MKVIEKMFKEAFRNGSKGVAHEISKILVRDWNFKLSDQGTGQILAGLSRQQCSSGMGRNDAATDPRIRVDTLCE